MVTNVGRLRLWKVGGMADEGSRSEGELKLCVQYFDSSSSSRLVV